MALLRINRYPSRVQLLVFAVAWLIAVGVLALTAWSRGRVGYATIAATCALIVPMLWFAAPAVLRWVFLGLSYATFPIGFVLSYVVLAVMYYLVFTPVGLLMRACGRDPLARRFDPAAKSYWQPRSEPASPAEYLRQR